MPRDTKLKGWDRRDKSSEGVPRRASFEASLKLLVDLDLSPDAIDCYRRLARKKRTLPHKLVRNVAERRAALLNAGLGLDVSRPRPPAFVSRSATGAS